MKAPVAMLALLDEATGLAPAWRDNVIVPLLILLVGLVVGTGVTFLAMVINASRAHRLAGRPRLARPELAVRSRRPTSPAGVPPARWLAIKLSNPRAVQTALGLHHPMPCSWEEGLSLVQDHKLFISPAVQGWILVMGPHLPDPADDVDRCFCFLLSVSRKLGQVQFFSLSRVLNHHAWAWVEQGRVQRAYAWAGKTIWNQGRLTRAEVDVGLVCFDYTDAAGQIDFAHPDPAALNVERIPLLAARWSVDPAAIDGGMLREARGIAGELSKSRAH
jgi:hypothetical protein